MAEGTATAAAEREGTAWRRPVTVRAVGECRDDAVAGRHGVAHGRAPAELIAHRSRAIGLSAIGALAPLTGWTAIGPAGGLCCARRRERAAGRWPARLRVTAVVSEIGVWLSAGWVARAVRSATSRRLSARLVTWIATVGAALPGRPRRVYERVAQATRRASGTAPRPFR